MHEMPIEILPELRHPIYQGQTSCQSSDNWQEKSREGKRTPERARVFRSIQEKSREGKRT
jgi:hypothetical protein